MSCILRSVILVISAVIFIACAGPEPIRWGNLHGNSASQGFQSITSGFALSSSWISNPYRITGSSPVIGLDNQRREVVYIGTTNAKLVAIRADDGTEKWQRRLGAFLGFGFRSGAYICHRQSPGRRRSNPEHPLQSRTQQQCQMVFFLS
jgi:hypothetical protein